MGNNLQNGFCGARRLHNIGTLWMRLNFLLLLLVYILAIPPQQTVQAAGTRYYVKGNGGSDLNSGLSWAQAFKTLQAALTVANSGDEVWVAKAAYYPDEGGGNSPNSRLATFTLENGVAIYGGFSGNETSLSQRNVAGNPTILSGDVDNNDVNTDGDFIAESTGDIVGNNAYHVVISSGNAATAILDGFIITAGLANDNADPNNKGGGLFAYQTSATLRNIAFVGNWAGIGGGVFCNGCVALSLTNIDITNNFALFTGGGMSNINSALSLTNGVFGDNLAGSSGGGMDNSGSAPILANVRFVNNQAPFGGGVANRFTSQADLTDVTITANYASSQGGGMANSNSNPSLSNVTFQGNSSQSGGGMYNLNSNPGILFTTFNGNQANFGGGVSNDNSRPNIQFSIFDANTATQAGGAIHNINGSHARIGMSAIQSNQAATGGGMYNFLSNPTVTNVDFLNNQATSNSIGGGGMFNYSSSPVLYRVNFTGNVAVAAGGGVYNYQGSHPKLTDVNLARNTAQNGGGMRNHAGNNQPQLDKVTFRGNSAVYGGGMSNDNSTPKLNNVTFSGNNAHQGGGMINYQSSPFLWNVTFYGNAARNANEGGGMYNLSASLPFLRNVILAGSINGDCVNGLGGNIAGEYTLIQDTGAGACGAIQGTSSFIVGQDPRLKALANNGGFTQTHALQKGSPAIDAVLNNNCPNEDQRGVTRPQKAYCDIGAFEYIDLLPVYLPLVQRAPAQ